MSIDAMKQALEALELEDMACRYEKYSTPEHIAKAITSLRQAIQEEALKNVARLGQEIEQEPAATVQILRVRGKAIGVQAHLHQYLPVGTKLYTHPPKREWFGLTEKDFSAINQSCLTKLQAATSAESILKDKNT